MFHSATINLDVRNKYKNLLYKKTHPTRQNHSQTFTSKNVTNPCDRSKLFDITEPDQDSFLQNFNKYSTLSFDHIALDHTYVKLQKQHKISEFSQNIKLCEIKLVEKNLVLQRLKGVRPSSVCCICGKILYPSCEFWLENVPFQEQRARNIIPEASHVNIRSKEKRMSDNSIKTLTSSCRECNGRYKKGKTVELFDDFGKQPQCITDLSSYTEYSKLAIAALSCNTFCPTGYSYLHLAGHVTWRDNRNILDGTIGVIKEGIADTLQTTNTLVKKAMSWLKKNNTLYESYVPQGETLKPFLDNQTVHSSFAGMPKWTDDMVIAHGGQLPVKDIKQLEGLLYPSRDFIHPVVPTSIKDINIGEQIQKKKNKMHDVRPLSYKDLHLEAKLFPHLFPYGKGSWRRELNALTIGAYHKMRLNNVDRRWANDRYYLYFTFDRMMKIRILYSNKALSTNRKHDRPVTAGDLNTSNDDYYKYGTLLPATITGSKSYMKTKWLQLLAIVRAKGPGDLFVTLTANDSWDVLKSILQQYENNSPILHPVDVSEYFFKRFEALHDILQSKKSVFGEVEYWWYRVESQNRGALHIHMILWIKQGTMRGDAIIAELPRGNDEESQHLRELVEKFQVHKCRPNRCFLTTRGKLLTKCKYGFPQKLRCSDGIDNDGI